MKKMIVVLIVALVVLASASAFTFKSVGIETGAGLFATGDMVIDEVSKDFEVYARMGYTGNFGFGIGTQYKVVDIKLGKSTLAMKPGLHMVFNLGNVFVFELLGGLEFSFDSGNLEAFLRPEFGVALFKGGNSFDWAVEAGIAYLFK